MPTCLQVQQWLFEYSGELTSILKFKKEVFEWLNSHKIRFNIIGKSESNGFIDVEFYNSNDVLQFKLVQGQWDHLRGPAYDSVILPLIRRAFPSIIANDIIGVQPMTWPKANIFSLKARYEKNEDDPDV